MHLVLNAKITVSKETFYRVNEVNIVKSAKLVENTANFKIPQTARLVRPGFINKYVDTGNYFKQGDEIAISLGYNGTIENKYSDGTLTEEFRGYVVAVKPGNPVEVMCEDQIYELRKKNLFKSFKSVSLKQLLYYIVEGTNIRINKNIPELQFEKFAFRNVTAAYALQKIKEEYGLTIYFRAWNELVVGLATENDNREILYEIGHNVISDDLETVSEDDTRIKIKAVLVQKNNTQITKEIGDKDGEQRTLYFYNISPKNLEVVAKEEIKKYKYNGLKGSIVAFLIPNVSVGNRIKIRDPFYPAREGTYLIDKMEVSFGASGGRRKIYLGLKVK